MKVPYILVYWNDFIYPYIPSWLHNSQNWLQDGFALMDWTSHISFLGRGLLLVGCMAGIVNPSKDPNVKKNKVDSNQVSITLNPKARDSGHWDVL